MYRCQSSWNVGTSHGRASEVVETIGFRHIDTCFVQEWYRKYCSASLFSVKYFQCKFIWNGASSGFEFVCIVLNENWIDKIVSMLRVNHCSMSLHILVSKIVVNTLVVYELQTGLSDDEKELL